MRSNRGITLTSLIIYIIVFSIVIGTVTTITGIFTSNLDYAVIETASHEQYTRFTTYLTNDINSINLQDINIKENNIIITFLDGTQHKYSFGDEKIYYISVKDGKEEKKIALCNNIGSYAFGYDDELKISVTIDGITYNNNYSI